MMRIPALPGQPVFVTEQGLKQGSEEDIALARLHLEVGRFYAVDRTVERRWCTVVYLMEFPGAAFNTEHFADVEGHSPILPQFQLN